MKLQVGRLFALFALLFAALARRRPRGLSIFQSYDVPLYTQVVNRIKAKVSARLEEGSNTRDRYFIIPFAYEDKGNPLGIFALVYPCHSSVCG
jgi:hypothetical protein